MKKHTLSANKRKIFGRKVRSLRKEGFVPGNVFGPKIKSIAVQFEKKSLLETIKSAGETSLITLSIEGDSHSHPVLLAGYHADPVTGAILHVDLHEVNLKEKTTASVPVKTTGEAPAVATGNILVLLKQEIEVEALPTDLPEEIVVDVSTLQEVGDSILAKDLKIDRSKLTLIAEEEEPIVTIQEPAKEEEPVVAEPAEGEEAAAGEAKPAEGEGEQAPEDKPQAQDA